MAPYSSSASISATLEMLESANFLNVVKQQKAGAAHPKMLFDIETVSMDGQPVQCSGGLSLTPKRTMDSVTETDLIIIPGFLFNILPALPLLMPVSKWLANLYDTGATIATICTGAFVAAQAGILDDKQATTHWYYAKEFKRRFPAVTLMDQLTVTDDGGLICSGGATAATDMLMYLVRKFGSVDIAAECSKKLLVDSCQRSQLPYMQYSFKRNHEDREIAAVQNWLDKHFEQEIVFDQLAKQFNFGQRNFIRRFKLATGETPNQYLQNLRIERAKYFLETTNTSLERVTYQVGYEDSNSFRRLFKNRVGLSPADYRKKFQVG